MEKEICCAENITASHIEKCLNVSSSILKLMKTCWNGNGTYTAYKNESDCHLNITAPVCGDDCEIRMRFAK
jgi:hypothetical protein